jgi:hypothetical protein
MAKLFLSSLKLGLQRCFGTLYDHLQRSYLVVFVALALCAVLLFAFAFLNSSPAPKVKILLKDEIGNARQRALEYCFNPRAVMAKGYAKVGLRADANGNKLT